MTRPVCGPFTHFGCEEGPHKSVEFTLLRTGGITFGQRFRFREEYKANGRDHHEADILRYMRREFRLSALIVPSFVWIFIQETSPKYPLNSDM